MEIENLSTIQTASGAQRKRRRKTYSTVEVNRRINVAIKDANCEVHAPTGEELPVVDISEALLYQSGV